MLSVVIPAFNEEESLNPLYAEIKSALKNSDYEIIFIDDGSTDKSLSLLKNFNKKDKRVRVYSFRKNQGKAEALTFGFQKVNGDYVATLDADLQDKPTEIPKLMDKAKEGWDVVCGWRKKRQDPPLKILSSRLFNFLTRAFWGLRLHDYNCGLKIYTKEAAKTLHIYGGLYRFIPLLLYQEGFRVCEVPVIHQGRKYGKSKYRFSKIWSDLPDIFTMLFLVRYSKRPLHFFGLIGFILFFFGFIILSYLTFIKFFGGGIGERPILFLGMLLVLTGFQVFLTGFLADLFINLSQRSSKNGSSNALLKYSSDESLLK